MKRVILFIVCWFAGLCLFAQPEESYTYEKETTWGINKNSAGGLIGGVMLKRSFKTGDRIYTTYGIEIVNLKSDQAVRKNTQLNNAYHFGKSNYFFPIRLQYGRDLVLFKKSASQGAEVKAVFTVGPSIGMQIPYHIEWQSTAGATTIEQYDPANSNHIESQIIGRAGWLDGLSGTKLKIGLNAKAAINFEIGLSPHSVFGFELGFLVDVYATKIPLVPAGEVRSVFPTLFISMFYGRRR